MRWFSSKFNYRTNAICAYAVVLINVLELLVVSFDKTSTFAGEVQIQ